MILSETPTCYAHAQNVLMLHVGPGNLRLFGTFVPIRTPSGTLVQIRTRLRLFRLSTFPFVLFRHASIRRLCLFLVVCSFQSRSNNLRLPTHFELFFESTRQRAQSKTWRLHTKHVRAHGGYGTMQYVRRCGVLTYFTLRDIFVICRLAYVAPRKCLGGPSNSGKGPSSRLGGCTLIM